MPIDPSIPLQAVQPLRPPDILGSFAKVAQLQAFAQQRQENEQQMAARAQQMEAQKLALDEAKRAQQDRALMNEHLPKLLADPANLNQDGSPKWEPVFNELTKRGVGVNAVQGLGELTFKVANQRAQYQNHVQDFEKKRREAADFGRAHFSDTAHRWRINGANSAALAGLIQYELNAPENAAYRTQIEKDYARLRDASPDEQAAIMRDIENRATPGERDARLKETKEGLAVDAAQRAQGVSEVLAIPVGPNGPDPKTYAEVRGRHPELGLPEKFDAAAVAAAVRSTIEPKNLADYDVKQAETQALKSLTPESIAAKVDAVVPPTGNTADLSKRTKLLAVDAVPQGLKAVNDVIAKAANEIEMTDRAVRTAKATAGTKIYLAGAEAAARAPKMSDDALDLQAEALLAGKPVPMRSPILYAKVSERAAELAKERGMTAQQAVMQQNAAKAYQGALNSNVKMYETLKPFGEMAEKNADILEKTLAQNIDLGASFLNTPLRELASKFGSTKTAALTAALIPVQNEFARVLNTATGAGVINIPAAKEMREAIKPGATLGEMRAALNVFRQEWKNRKEGMEASIADLKLKSVGAPTAEAAPPLPQQLSQSDVGKSYTDRNGKVVKIKAVNPQNPKQYQAE